MGLIMFALELAAVLFIAYVIYCAVVVTWVVKSAPKSTPSLPAQVPPSQWPPVPPTPLKFEERHPYFVFALALVAIVAVAAGLSGIAGLLFG